MSIENTKGLKPFIIKYMAMLMGICYLINPLQEQVHVLLHEISHAMESPTQIIAHGYDSNLGHRSFDHYDTTINDLQHDHGIVDLINTIFETSNEKNQSEESLLVEVKIDKHLTTNQLQLPEYFKINTSSAFERLEEKSKCGYFGKVERPPQHSVA